MKSVHYKFEIPVRLSIMNNTSLEEDSEEETQILFKDLSESDQLETYKCIQDDFDSAMLEQYIHDEGLVGNVLALRITGKTEIGVECTAIISRRLKISEIKKLMKWLTGGCSDGWGEGFEQQEKRIGKNKLCYIQTWWRDNFPGIKKI